VPEYGGAGFLPATAGPFVLGADGDAARILRAGAGNDAVDRLVDALDALDGAPRSAGEAARDQFVRQARRMSEDPEVRAAFDLTGEPHPRRERFGNHALGRACLSALRLCRAGVQTVLVRDTGWDHHQGVRRALTHGFPGKLPALDQVLSALLDELRDEAGEAITVAVLTEFGRTPRLNPDGGRDHWPRAQSALLFGAGVRHGVVHGTTDARGEEPASDPCSPGDLWATLLAARGADLDAVLATDTGRPVTLVPDGAKPIAAVLAE
jgi:hypothetical protein